MFGNGEGLQSQVTFAVAATYDKFAKKWGLSNEKLSWVDTWATMLERFSVQEINSVADYCVEALHRPPGLGKFIILASRYRAGKPLSEPIVSKVERMAYLILTSETFTTSDMSLSEISDACLIAAAIAHLKSYKDLHFSHNDAEFIVTELGERARTFAEEAANWKKDSEKGKSYWRAIFQGRDEG